MKVLLIIALLSLPLVVFCQCEKKLYCGNCGQKNTLASRYCYNCGQRLDKSALVDRLKTRLAAADSAKQPITLSTGEISALVDAEVEIRIVEQGRRRGEIIRTAPKTSTEKTLDIIAPILTVVVALFLVSRSLF